MFPLESQENLATLSLEKCDSVLGLQAPQDADKMGLAKLPLYLLGQLFSSKAQRNHSGVKCLAFFKDRYCLLFLLVVL